MTRVAVVGVGAMGRNHARVYQEMPEVKLVAIADEDPASAEPLSRQYRVPVYADYQEMVRCERPEAVSVAVPTAAHCRVAADLLHAGCHVLVEKPIAASIEEAQTIIQAAEQAGRLLMVGHIERYNPAVVELKHRLSAGELGRVFQIHARRLGPFPARIQDVGVVMDLATHDLDIMCYLTGSQAVRVFAETRRELHQTCEDLFAGTLRFADQTIGLLEINWLTPAKIRELYVTGERGMFYLNYITQDLCFYENAAANGADWSALSLLRGVSEGSMVQYAIHKKEPLRAELEAFIAQVKREAVRVGNAWDAMIALSLAASLAESALTGQVKEVSGYERRRASDQGSEIRDQQQPVSVSQAGI